MTRTDHAALLAWNRAVAAFREGMTLNYLSLSLRCREFGFRSPLEVAFGGRA